MPYYDGLNETIPIGSCLNAWPSLVKLLEKDCKVWPCWRKFQKIPAVTSMEGRQTDRACPLLPLPTFPLSDQDVTSLCYSCHQGFVRSTILNSETVISIKLFKKLPWSQSFVTAEKKLIHLPCTRAC